MKTIKDRVVHLLTKREDSRDSDDLLISLFWFYESKEIIKDLSANDFLKLFAEGKITSSESIRRCRQKIQEKNPSLQGDSYKERKKEEENVRENIDEL